MNQIQKKKEAEARAFAEEYGMTFMEAVLELVFMYYESAGFDPQPLEDEFCSMSDKELLAVYFNL